MKRRTTTTRRWKRDTLAALAAAALALVAASQARAWGWGEVDTPVLATPTAPSAPTAAAATEPDATVTSGAPLELAAPEVEIARALESVDSLLRRLDAAREEAGRAGLGPQTIQAQQAYANAMRYFDLKEWLSTIRELNNYLNQTQVPELRPYLRSQYVLGRSYEELSMKSRALRAYFRYLAAFLTAKEGDNAELLEVLRRMLPLAADGDADSRKMNELLASAATMDWPDEVRPSVLFYAAKAAGNAGQMTIADEWLEKAVAGNGSAADPALKSRVLYMRALLQLGRKDYDAAEETLGQITTVDNDPATRDLARLALARIAVHRRHPDSALKLYALVPEDSASYKDALFESLYVHLDKRQDGNARAKAMLFLARWPGAPEALQLKLLIAWLDMRAGEYDSAAKSIQSANSGLKEVNSWVSSELAGSPQVSRRQVEDFLKRSNPYITPIPSVQEAYKLFARLAEATRRLADARGEIRDATYALGRVELRHIRPEWTNRAEQLSRLGNAALEIGHRLAATERGLYGDKLSKLDRQRLSASESRRVRLLSPAAVASRKLEYWASYAAFHDLTLSVAKTWEKLRKAGAELASARLAAQRAVDSGAADADLKLRRVAELEEKRVRLDAAAGRALEVLRKRRVGELLRQSPHRPVRKFLSQYTLALQEEATIVAPTRDAATSTSERLNSEDAARAWQRWEFLMAEVFRQIDALELQMTKGLATMIADIEAQEQRHDQLASRVATLTKSLEQRLGGSLSYLIEQYSAAVDARFARHKKWLADLDGLAYREAVDEERQLKEKVELERQILRDNLNDLQQGVLWQWPE